MGCFTQSSQVCISKREIWDKINLDNCKDKFLKLHTIFQHGDNIFEGYVLTNITYMYIFVFCFRNIFEKNKIGEVPPHIFNALFVLRLLLDLALDNYEK